MGVRREARLILLALVVGLAAALVAGCGGSKVVSAQQASDQTSGAKVVLNGSGATFPEPIYVQWAGEFNKSRPDVQVNYQGIGSGGGIEQFTNQITDFGASDAPMSDEELAAAQKAGGPVLHIPMVLGSVAVTYNVSGVKDLKLDGPTLANIFLGKIKKWNDPQISKLNPGVSLPGDDVKVVHRSDSSGTSYIFTGYLSAVSPEWKSKVGQDKAPEWPTGIGGEGNDGVAAAIQQTKGAIGYNELGYALENKIAYATLKSANGEWIKPSSDSTSAAGSGVTYPDDLRFSLLNSKAPGAYPIVSATWILAWKNPAQDGFNRQKAKDLIQFLSFGLAGDAQKQAPDLGYAKLPKDLQSLALKAADSIQLPKS